MELHKSFEEKDGLSLLFRKGDYFNERRIEKRPLVLRRLFIGPFSHVPKIIKTMYFAVTVGHFTLERFLSGSVMSVTYQTRAPHVFESRNNSSVGLAHAAPAVLRGFSEMRIPSRHLVAQHQHRGEFGFGRLSNLVWDHSM